MTVDEILKLYDPYDQCNSFDFINEAGKQFAEFNALKLDIYLEGDFSLQDLETLVAVLKQIKAVDE